MSSSFLWLYAPAYLPDNPRTLLVKSYHELRSPVLMAALQNKLPQAELVKAVFPEFDEQKHIARLGQEVDRSAGIPIRFLQIFEVMEDGHEYCKSANDAH